MIKLKNISAQKSLKLDLILALNFIHITEISNSDAIVIDVLIIVAPPDPLQSHTVK